MSGEMVFPRSRLALSVLAAAVAAGCFVGAAGATETPSASLASCSDLDIPAKPPHRVWCRTAAATLVIAHQSDPVLLAGTEVRILSAELLGSGVRVRTRVRNATEAVQWLSAGGQELYLNVAGERVDLAIFRDVALDVGEAKTIQLDYALAPEQLTALRADDGRLDFGVRPWHDGVSPAPLVGVVRVRLGA